jgi:Na+-transporting NADH:ubiquinone oxidoreductase subunit NqrE
MLSYVRVSRQLQIALIGELELCNGYRDYCFKLLIAFGIGLTWLLSQVLMAQITSRTHLSDKLW